MAFACRHVTFSLSVHVPLCTRLDSLRLPV